MRAPPPNNKNGAASMTFKMAIKIMEQYQQNQTERQQKQQEWFMEMMEMIRKQTERNTKFLMDVILSRNGRMNIDTTQLMHNLGEHINVSETQADDRSTKAATDKPVPHQEWLDWVERAKK